MTSVRRMLASLALASLTTTVSVARPVKQSPVDSATIDVETLPRDVTFVVERFGVDHADLGSAEKPGKTKAQATADIMKESAPTILQDALVKTLSSAGTFATVVEAGAEAPPEGAVRLAGEFTVLNPGSKGKRFWVGMGAGQSRVCIEARVIGADGKDLGTLRNCRSGTGSWSFVGGKADAMMTTDVVGTAEHVADFLAAWTKGQLGH